MTSPKASHCFILTAILLSSVAAILIGCSSSTSTASTGSSGSSSSGSTWTGGGDGIWRRNAVYAEAFNFDPCNAHQPPSGEYHYHDNPVCLRYQLNDNLTATNVGTQNATYTEKTTGLTHSPILGWSYDGYPVYGPYSYANTNGAGDIRRMVSSYALRTDNTTTRTSLPAWAQTYQGLTTLTSTQYGPPVSTTYPLGRYIEDYNYTAGSGDLDQYNGRFCVTPEFPSGTYAYFVTIDATGAPAFPYYIAAQYYGTVSGGSVTSVTETTTTYFNNHVLQGSSSSMPAINSWYTANSSQYAQIIDPANTAAGLKTTWTGNTTATYADPQEVRYSASWVYINAAGLASHVMGPWWLNTAKTQPFNNYPSNQNVLDRIPITPSVAGTKTNTGGGAQGRWVNGVSMFNMLDFYSWSNASQADVGS